MILAGTCDELSLGKAKVDRHTDTHTYTHSHTGTGNDNTRRPKGPRVKIEDKYHFVMECKTSCDFREMFLNKLKDGNRDFVAISQREPFVYIFTKEENMSLRLRVYTLSYNHHQIGSMNYYPLFMVRSWNNGIRCMSLYILVINYFQTGGTTINMP